MKNLIGLLHLPLVDFDEVTLFVNIVGFKDEIDILHQKRCQRLSHILFSVMDFVYLIGIMFYRSKPALLFNTAAVTAYLLQTTYCNHSKSMTQFWAMTEQPVVGRAVDMTVVVVWSAQPFALYWT